MHGLVEGFLVHQGFSSVPRRIYMLVFFEGEYFRCEAALTRSVGSKVYADSGTLTILRDLGFWV